MVKTTKVQGRRDVRYSNLEDLLADAESLAAGKPELLGNWNLGQILGHIACAMNASIDGFPGRMPFLLKLIAGLFMRKMILKGPLRPGFKLPETAEAKLVPPSETTAEEGLELLKAAISRQNAETRRVPHLALGELSVADWASAHLRHAELHMSFAVLKD